MERNGATYAGISNAETLILRENVSACGYSCHPAPYRPQSSLPATQHPPRAPRTRIKREKAHTWLEPVCVSIVTYRRTSCRVAPRQPSDRSPNDRWRWRQIVSGGEQARGGLAGESGGGETAVELQHSTMASVWLLFGDGPVHHHACCRSHPLPRSTSPPLILYSGCFDISTLLNITKIIIIFYV